MKQFHCEKLDLFSEQYQFLVAPWLRENIWHNPESLFSLQKTGNPLSNQNDDLSINNLAFSTNLRPCMQNSRTDFSSNEGRDLCSFTQLSQ